MKKILAILLACMCIFAFAACDNADSGNANVVSTPAPTGPVFDLPDTDFAAMMPEVIYEILRTESDDNGTTIYFEFMTLEEFEFYLTKVEAVGFNVEPEKTIDEENAVYEYKAYNDKGYEFKLHTDSEGSEMGVYIGRFTGES